MHSLNKNYNAAFLTVMILSLTLTFHSGEAQTDNLVLPDGFGINQIQTTENLSSGVLNINLPIESFLVPVSLSYSTGGIRVSERAGVVGLGWKLNAGGFVARQKRGSADGYDNGYSGLNKRGDDITTLFSMSTFESQATEDDPFDRWDTHPDIFYFQFGNYSGQFVLDANRDVIKLTPNNLDITPIHNSTLGYVGFKIVDENGNIYEFNGISPFHNAVYNEGDLEAAYFSKWPIDKITNYSTGDYITFTYLDAPLYTEFNKMKWKSPGQSTFEGSTEIKTDYSSVLIDEIRFYPNDPGSNSESLIEFNYISRTDVTSKKALDNILYSVNGNQQVTYNFDYSYLGEGTASRLMLTGISKSSLSIPLYQFAYFGQNKNEYTLPDYNSYDQDHWGYFNNNPINHRFDGLDGADLDPNLYRTQANTLKKIYHTSGGFEEFEYELNNYYNGSQNINVGGLRIKKIRRGDFDGNTYSSKVFEYLDTNGNSSGELYAEPMHQVTMSDNGNDFQQYREHSYEPLQDHMGRHIVYENVTVSLLGSGRVENTFLTFEDDDNLGTGINQDLHVVELDYGIGGNDLYTHTYSNVHQGPFGFKSFKGGAAGQLQKRESFDYAGNKLKTETYIYTDNGASNKILGMNYALFGSGSNDFWFNVDFYELGDGYKRLSEIQTTVYDLNDVNKKLKTITQYTYHGTYHLPKTVKTFLSPEVAADTRETTTTYLFEDPGTLTDIVADNLLALVKTKTEKVGTQTLATQTTTFVENGSGKIVPDRVQAYNDTKLVNDQSFVYDSDTDKLISTIDNLSGSQSTQFWNVDGTQIVAEIGNAASEDCAFTSFEGDEIGNWVMPAMTSGNEEIGLIGQAYDLGTGSITKSLTADKEYFISYWYKNGTVSLSGLNSNQLIQSRSLNGWTFEERLVSRTTDGDVTLSGLVHIDHLSLYPRGAMMNSYTYHDMFGKTSETDANNNSIFYEYDDAGRIKLIRDKNQDIISSKEYEITQYLHASWPEADVNFGGETFEILVESNGPWKVTKSSWITVSPTSGDGVGNITATISNNPNTTTRSGNITIKEDNTPTTGVPDFVIDVSQDAAPSNYIVVNPSIVEIEAPVTVDIASNKSWTATVTNNPGNRISIIGSNTGSGDGSITINAVNTTGSPLSGVVTVAADDSSVNAIINVYF